MSNKKTGAYAAAHFGFLLDGKDEVGLFKSIEGGTIKTDVMTYSQGTDFSRWKQLGKQKYEDVKLQVGMAMSAPFYKWIDGFFNNQVDRRNGVILAADFHYVERARRTITNALIKEITTPKFDGADKNAAYMGVTLAIESAVIEPGTGQKLSIPTGFDKQKVWTTNNFEFVVDGFTAACRRVTKVDSFTIKQNILEHHVGGERAPLKFSSQVEFPNITFYVPEPDVEPFVKHFTKRGIKGEVPTTGRLTGSLRTFDSDRKELWEMTFSEADICNVSPDKSDAGSEEIKQVKIELYVGSMKFAWKG